MKTVDFSETIAASDMKVGRYCRQLHYANMSVQYNAIFHGYKNDYFQMKNCNIFVFLLKTLIVGTR